MLCQRIMGVESDMGFTLIMHLATLLAVVAVMRKQIAEVVTTPKKWGPIIVATLCSALIVLALKGFMLDSLDGRFLPTCFLITALMLLVGGMVKPKKREIGYLDAVIIGCVQGVAALPGISRSGSTVSASLMLGNDREKSVSFSFLLSIPIIVGSALIDVITEGVGSLEFLPTLCGFAAAFFSGLFAVKFMLSLSAGAYDFFAVYLTALSAFLIVNDLFLHIF